MYAWMDRLKVWLEQDCQDNTPRRRRRQLVSGAWCWGKHTDKDQFRVGIVVELNKGWVCSDLNWDRTKARWWTLGQSRHRVRWVKHDSWSAIGQHHMIPIWCDLLYQVSHTNGSQVMSRQIVWDWERLECSRAYQTFACACPQYNKTQ